MVAIFLSTKYLKFYGLIDQDYKKKGLTILVKTKPSDEPS